MKKDIETLIRIIKAQIRQHGKITIVLEDSLTILDALEKQMPKPVTLVDDNEFICSSCGVATQDKDIASIKFCPHCGQALK